MCVVGSGEVTGGDGINKAKEPGLRSTGLAQLREELGPFVVQHRLKALPGYVARSRTVEIIADFLIVGGNRFGDCAGRSSDKKEPARDFLSGADFGERAEGGWIEIEGERFVVSVEFLSGRHNTSSVDSQLPALSTSLRRRPLCFQFTRHSQGIYCHRRDDSIIRAIDQIVQIAGRDGAKYG